MVYHEGGKYACEACIKGHRSSLCYHTDRPLFEIKRKGRPITQCQHCRQLRKTKQVHIKCSCEGLATDSDTSLKKSRGKVKRKMPTTPVFPDGIKGGTSDSSAKLLDPEHQSSCPKSSVDECTCATPVSKPSTSSTFTFVGPTTPHPAASSYHGESKSIGTLSKAKPLGGIVQASAAPSLPSPYPSVRDLTPSLNTELTGTPGVGLNACSCGITCVCPGCLEHANPATGLTSEGCPSMCSTCNDCNEFGFPPPSSSTLALGTTWQSLDMWPTSLAPVSLSPAFRCGGSCKCETQSMPCHCVDSCCGCCLGCACSDSEKDDSDPIDCSAPRLGFAVSGERASCRCEENKTGYNVNVDLEGQRSKRHKPNHEPESEEPSTQSPFTLPSLAYNTAGDFYL